MAHNLHSAVCSSRRPIAVSCQTATRHITTHLLPCPQTIMGLVHALVVWDTVLAVNEAVHSVSNDLWSCWWDMTTSQLAQKELIRRHAHARRDLPSHCEEWRAVRAVGEVQLGGLSRDRVVVVVEGASTDPGPKRCQDPCLFSHPLTLLRHGFLKSFKSSQVNSFFSFNGFDHTLILPVSCQRLWTGSLPARQR